MDFCLILMKNSQLVVLLYFIVIISFAHEYRSDFKKKLLLRSSSAYSCVGYMTLEGDTLVSGGVNRRVVSRGTQVRVHTWRLSVDNGCFIMFPSDLLRLGLTKPEVCHLG